MPKRNPPSPAKPTRSPGSSDSPEPPNAPKPPGRRRAVLDARVQLGRAGEAAAARFLEARGYRIVARNVRADRVEMDLIARRGPLLVFVEVKTRRSNRYGSAAESVDARKQSRLRRGARAWLATKPPEARGMRRLRFDVVTCTKASEGRNTTTAPKEARWLMEHWEAAF